MHPEEVVMKIKNRIRVKTTKADEEVTDLIEAAKMDMAKEGIYGDADNPLYFQAMVLYCKAYYGYDEKTEQFQEAYKSLKNSMALSGDYTKEGMQNGD